jgi:hypothetical protein
VTVLENGGRQRDPRIQGSKTLDRIKWTELCRLFAFRLYYVIIPLSPPLPFPISPAKWKFKINTEYFVAGSTMGATMGHGRMTMDDEACSERHISPSWLLLLCALSRAGNLVWARVGELICGVFRAKSKTRESLPQST